MAEYDDWDLELLREECGKRRLEINSKDGVKTTAARLRASDKLDKFEKGVEKSEKVDTLGKQHTERGGFENNQNIQNVVNSRGNLKLASELNNQNEEQIPRDTESVILPKRQALRVL